jgi:hypothetical protein
LPGALPGYDPDNVLVNHAPVTPISALLKYIDLLLEDTKFRYNYRLGLLLYKCLPLKPNKKD